MPLNRSQHIDLLEGVDWNDDSRLRHSRRRVLDLLRGGEAPFDRFSYSPGHVTASAVVVSPDGHRFALVYHERLGRWLQPGGHIESGDEHARHAAAREVREETGLVVSHPAAPLVGIDVHDIPAARGEPAHLHYDLCFLFHTREETFASGEGLACIWADDETMERHAIDAPLRRSIRRARQVLTVTPRPVFTPDGL